MKALPFAWAVIFKYNGEDAKFICLERSRADDYAAQHHGTIHGLYLEDQFVCVEQAKPIGDVK